MYEEFIRNRITELRMNADISECRLSLKLGHGMSYIQSITSGKSNPSLTGLFEICAYFGLTPSEFFDPNMKNPSLMHHIVKNLKKLPKEHLAFFNEGLNRYLNRSCPQTPKQPAL